MGLFGHGGGLSKIGHSIGHVLDHYDEVLRSHNAPDVYIGASYGENGFTPNVQVNPGARPTASTGKPNAYSRNTARTANDIAQGGMTKDEVVEFNIRHPNETAGG